MELSIATGVVLTAIVLLAGVLVTGIKATGTARERQSATGLANQAMEKIRALPFATVAAGLNQTDLANTAGGSDPNLSTSGCGGTYCFGGEQVASTNDATVVDPLNPHTTTTTVGPTTYTVRSYVTLYKAVGASSPTPNTYRATVYVTWPSKLVAVAQKVQVQTIIYTQGNCLSTVTHARSGPCQPAFTSSAVADGGTIDANGVVGTISVDHATLLTGRATSDETLEQNWRVTGVSQGAGGVLQSLGGPANPVGRPTASSQADNDPDTPSATIYDTHSMPGQGSANQSLTSSPAGDSITVATTGGDTGQTTSTTSACTTSCPATSSPIPRNCPNLAGYTNENDTDGNTPANPLPCGGSSSQSGATATINANMTTLGSIALASLGPQVSPTVALTDRSIQPGTGKCATTTGPDGCLWSKVSRSAIDMSAGALPSNLNVLSRPVGFTSFVQLQGITDSVTAEAGKNSAAPTGTQSAGSVKVWCASAVLGNLLCPLGTVAGSYVTKALGQITSTVTTPVFTLTDLTLGGGTTITMSTTVTPPTIVTNSNCSGTCDRTTASAISQPPIVTFNYTIVTNGTQRLNLTFRLDPGPIKASATYVPAPTN